MTTSIEWNEERIQRLIDDEVEESLTLEYKGADALAKSEGTRKEISKDISAMANSAGGIVIYGIREYSEEGKRHLPAAIEPINRSHFSKEWLEQVINSGVHPKIPDLKITPVPVETEISKDKVVYVVEVQQSLVPHQATGYKIYYRRYNFKSSPMDDYEINDIRNRRFVVESLVSFAVEVRYGNIIFFMLENPGTLAAKQVRFSFSKELKWHDGHQPSVFDRGIAFLPPGRKLSFIYRDFAGILDDEASSSSFDLAISYFHPRLGREIEEGFHIDFADFLNTVALKPELEEQTEKAIKELRDLTRQVQRLGEHVERLSRIVGPSGLQVSITTLQNLKHIADGDEFFDKVNPNFFPLNVDIYREILGVDYQLASRIAWHFRWPESGGSLRSIEGMTEEIYKKLLLHFKVDEEE